MVLEGEVFGVIWSWEWPLMDRMRKETPKNSLVPSTMQKYTEMMPATNQEKGPQPTMQAPCSWTF